MKLVVQEQPMACGLACVASVAGVSFSKVLSLVNAKHASGRGYYCEELVAALKRLGLQYTYAWVTASNRKYLKKPGTIVFIQRCKKYPEGHYLLRTLRGWMNPWINHPLMTPAKAGYQKRLPGIAQWILYKVS